MDPDFDPPNDDETAQDGEAGGHSTPTARVIEAFGGIRPMAHKLGIPVTTVQGWKRRNHIPDTRHLDIEAAARAHGVTLEAGLLEAAGLAPGHEGAAPAPAPAAALLDGRPAPAAVETPTDRPEPQSAAGGSGTPSGVWTATAIAVAAAIVSISAPFWAPGLFGPAPAEVSTPPVELVSLGDRVEFLENRVAELPATPIASTTTVTELADRLRALEERAVPEPDTGRIDAVEARLDELAARLDRIEERLQAAETSLSSGIDSATLDASLADLRRSLTERLDAVERLVAEVGPGDAALQALAVAAGTLRAAVIEGRPWATDLDTVRALSAKDPEIEAIAAMLAPRAGTGVATAGRLRSAFTAAAEEARLAAGVPENAGVIDRALDAVTGLVSVRPAPGEVEGDAPDQILARAEGRLIDGDLTGAAEAVAALSGPPADAMAAWLAEARSRLDATSAADRLVAVSLARLGGASGGSGAP